MDLSPVEPNLECKNRRLHNPSDGKITSLVEIDRRKKHICIGARNDISMNAKMQKMTGLTERSPNQRNLGFSVKEVLELTSGMVLELAT